MGSTAHTVDAVPFHAFVDESKARTFILVSTTIESSRVTQARRELRQLLLPGQRRLHFHREQERRRAVIVDGLLDLPVLFRVYRSADRDEGRARASCLRGLADQLAVLGVERLVIESDDSRVRSDVATLTSATRELRARSSFTFHHLPAHVEPLLWASDAAAWCWSRGGGWRQRIEPLIADVIDV